MASPLVLGINPGSTAAVPVSGTEAALAVGEIAQGTQEIHAPEIGPERLAEVELRVGALPGEEAGQPLFAGGPDDQLGVGLAAGVQVLCELVRVQVRRYLCRVKPLCLPL